jgi:hypothetical protein
MKLPLLTMYEVFSNFQSVSLECRHILREKLIGTIQQRQELIAARTARLETFEAATSVGNRHPSSFY